MEPDRADPIGELQRAWRDLETPPSSRPLAEEDELTRATVAWLQRAWSALETPPLARQPLRRRGVLLRSVRPRLARPGWLLRVAAALLLLTSVAGLALLSQLAGPSPRQAAAELVVSSPPPSGAVPPSTPATITHPMVVDNRRPDRVELRSGRVHLTLLRSSAANLNETHR